MHVKMHQTDALKYGIFKMISRGSMPNPRGVFFLIIYRFLVFY